MSGGSYDVIVIGGGPAGLSAGIYLARGNMKTLILNEGTVGGQLVLTHEIANYPGVEQISGYKLATIMKKQAMDFGCAIRANVNITGLWLDGDVKSVEVNGKEAISASAVVLASGGRPRMLGVPGEQEFKGRGVSYCATCDGDFFRDRDILVVGGGNSALEEAVSLTAYACTVTVVHQFDHFQAFPHAIEEARKNPKISFIMESTIAEFIGEQSLRRVSIRNLSTGAIGTRDADGVFIFIGYLPNTKKYAGIVALNEAGEILTGPALETSLRGVFAAGDSIAKRYRQVTTAVADGTIAALSAMEYLRTSRADAPIAELMGSG